MKCEHCENPATIHVTHVAEGKVVKTHLCGDCAAKLGIANPAVSLADTLLGPGTPVLPTRALTCPACGLSLRKFQKEGRLGCPECYRTFAREVQTVLKSLHDASAHRGRIPRSFRRDPDPEEILASLRKRLSDAVKSEAFEEAARLRDDIRELTASLCPSHPEPASP